MQSLYSGMFGSIGMDLVLSESCLNGHFPIIPLYNSVLKKFRSDSMTVLYLNLCYYDVRYKETALYCYLISPQIFLLWLSLEGVPYI